MADSQETRVLKEINRHLKNMSDKGPGQTLSPSETANLQKNTKVILGNFESIMDAKLKRVVLTTDRAFNEAFGNLKGFNAEQNAAQIAALDDVIDELQISNQWMDKSMNNQFLAEQARENELKIDMRTNDLLEELVDQGEDEAEASAKADASASGFLGGLLPGLFAGKSLGGLLRGVKGLAKKAFLPAVALAAGVEFLRGWEEAGEDATVLEKFNSGTAKMLSSLTFGLVSKEFFQNMLENAQKAIGVWWEDFKGDWEAFVNGELSGKEFFAEVLSGLTGGAIDPKTVEKITDQIADGFADLMATIVDAIVDGLVTPLIASLKDRFGLLFTDPVQFFKNEWEGFKEKQKEKARQMKELQAKYMAEGMDEFEARQKAIDEVMVADMGIFDRAKYRLTAKARDAVGLGADRLRKKAQKEAEQAARDEKRKKEAAERRAIRDAEVAEAREKRGITGDTMMERIKSGLFGTKKEPAPVSQKAIDNAIKNEEALRRARERTQEGQGATVVNAPTTQFVAPPDSRTENDDIINLQRTGKMMPLQSAH